MFSIKMRKGRVSSQSEKLTSELHDDAHINSEEEKSLRMNPGIIINFFNIYFFYKQD
jgi:hypothetical protein